MWQIPLALVLTMGVFCAGSLRYANQIRQQSRVRYANQIRQQSRANYWWWCVI